MEAHKGARNTCLPIPECVKNSPFPLPFPLHSLRATSALSLLSVRLLGLTLRSLAVLNLFQF